MFWIFAVFMTAMGSWFLQDLLRHNTFTVDPGNVFSMVACYMLAVTFVVCGVIALQQWNKFTKGLH